VLELLHEFSPEEAGVLWDIEHTHRHGELPIDTATALRRFIAHVHVKDSIRVDGKNQQKLLGDGDIPLADAVRALRELGYDGWYSLETEKRWHAEVARTGDVSTLLEWDADIPEFEVVHAEARKGLAYRSHDNESIRAAS